MYGITTRQIEQSGFLGIPVALGLNTSVSVFPLLLQHLEWSCDALSEKQEQENKKRVKYV